MFICEKPNGNRSKGNQPKDSGGDKNHRTSPDVGTESENNENGLLNLGIRTKIGAFLATGHVKSSLCKRGSKWELKGPGQHRRQKPLPTASLSSPNILQHLRKRLLSSNKLAFVSLDNFVALLFVSALKVYLVLTFHVKCYTILKNSRLFMSGMINVKGKDR